MSEATQDQRVDFWSVLPQKGNLRMETSALAVDSGAIRGDSQEVAPSVEPDGYDPCATDHIFSPRFRKGENTVEGHKYTNGHPLIVNTKPPTPTSRHDKPV